MLGVLRSWWAERARRACIEFDDRSLRKRHEFAGRSPEIVETLAWSDVSRVTAFKLDLITVDEVRLRFESDAGVSIELSESEPGWSELLLALPQRLPGFPPGERWLHEIVQPPFATNEMKLYERDSEAEDGAG